MMTAPAWLLLSLAACASAFTTSGNRPIRPRSSRAVKSSLRMVDQNVLIGGGVAVSGFATGIFAAWFSEQQIVRAEERGSAAVSDGTRARMSAMFMEDEVMPETDLDETVRRMEEAMAKAKGEETTEEETAKPVAAAPKDDGW
mmetsp:Transcript_1508/g.3857  ORF Transcript_1508/g.3857 Transcript_1508/m.3857 type:complete len:143 (+) Transcript_1508:60-488(+)